MPDQTPKNVLITGAAQGIGRCIARHYAEAGHRVFLVDINEEELTYTAKEHLKAHSSRLAYSICNLRSLDSIRETAAKAAKFFNDHIDILINNAGIASPKWKDGKTMLDPSIMPQWQAYMETNLTAPFAMTQACLPYMKRPPEKAEDPTDPGPCVILVGSFRAHQSDPDQEGYAATKAGLIGLMHAMAVSCERWGVRVNLVAPGRVKVAHESKEGDQKGKTWEGQEGSEDAEQHPAGRAGTPEDIFHAVQYLVDAGWVTGQDLTVDGGVLRKKNR
ncbi:NAD(P)-binding protein [Trichodelitschia bisporula]|uniref:NAD(P)-binding protein n=1 Tax=Trichodelitschia bisporula TaxID=703511 RepID=A0A6G1HIZ7_9PEZI|nr:NAD(P)-binding protein [Trichodelitschia bisporula]